MLCLEDNDLKRKYSALVIKHLALKGQINELQKELEKAKLRMEVMKTQLEAWRP